MGSKSKTKKSRRKKNREEFKEKLFEFDETFAFIAGYTSGGAPSGVTWEEMEEIEKRDNGLFGKEYSYHEDKEIELPFD